VAAASVSAAPPAVPGSWGISAEEAVPRREEPVIVEWFLFYVLRASFGAASLRCTTCDSEPHLIFCVTGSRGVNPTSAFVDQLCAN